MSYCFYMDFFRQYQLRFCLFWFFFLSYNGENLPLKSIRLLIHLALVSKMGFFLKIISLVLSLGDGFERPFRYTGYGSILKPREYSPNRLQVLWYQQRFKCNIKFFLGLAFNYPVKTFSSNTTTFNWTMWHLISLKFFYNTVQIYIEFCTITVIFRKCFKMKWYDQKRISQCQSSNVMLISDTLEHYL